MEVFEDKYRCQVGEGPIWDADNNNMIFLDILGKCIFIADYSSGDIKKINVGQMVGCMALCENGNILLGMEDGVYRLNDKGDIILAHKPTKIKGERFNDGKVGPDGCFYLGTSDKNGEGAFYRFRDGELTELFSGCGCSNGLDWSVDETKMFYCDSPLHKIEVFDFDKENNNISGRRTFAEIDMSLGTPDGLTIDTEDNLWVALWDGEAVIKINTDGKITEKVDIPAKKSSSCCFAGKNLEDLIITSASKGDEKYYPLAGYVFKENVGAKGRKSYKYKY